MSKNKHKVLFVTGLFSPFQIDMAYEINKVNLFEYYVAFTLPYALRRGKHWQVKVKKEYDKYIIVPNNIISPKMQAVWASRIIMKVRPQIVISGFYKGPIFKEIAKTTKNINSILAFWGEPPNLLYSKLLIKIYQKLILNKNLKNAKFIFGIGERAVNIYKENFPGDVYLVPYAQDLSTHFNINRKTKTKSEKITFLFSGQLVRRHNIRLIAKALMKLYKLYPNKFVFVIAGYGPEEYIFWDIIRREPEIEKQIIWDREYETWEDRVKPFYYSDVLIYPSKHAGWGLVVPEAMASGIVVITTSKVGAARYYIKDGVNGIFIEPAFEQLYIKLEWCINNKDNIFKMGKQARIDVKKKGTAITVSKQFCNIVRRYLT